MFVTQSFNHVLPPCNSIVLHYRIHFQAENLLEKGSKFEEDKIPRVDDDAGQSALSHKYHENAFISIVLYTTESTSMPEIYC
jgi:hypothetical protein